MKYRTDSRFSADWLLRAEGQHRSNKREECFTPLQGDGCEQEDALISALFSPGFNEVLQAAQHDLEEDDYLITYLDDVCLCTTRVKKAFDTTVANMKTVADIRVHLGKHTMLSPW